MSKKAGPAVSALNPPRLCITEMYYHRLRCLPPSYCICLRRAGLKCELFLFRNCSRLASTPMASKQGNPRSIACFWTAPALAASLDYN
ncbi:hypothetical protein IF1G_02037 [Cordyceps javanica]|uniref:Uncharacterized protein n=1 Tax=Cordyceps javanica TaxID=43265 RepID=A0A545W946_9HYPO|nr:hypothetical protein IF1G_02037 [Cordyceps javanica]TQW10513.1 hypothetical protein IF2G_01455 [Cordyceps javanica]